MISHHPAAAGRANDRGQHGSVILLTAVLMTSLLIMTSIVVDLGLARVTRRDLQTVSDVAALAAGFHLSGHGNPYIVADPRGACAAAFRSARSNLPSMAPAAAISCAQLPASAESPDCDASTPMRTITASGTAPYVLKISYPVTDPSLADSNYLDGAGWNDGQPCMRMMVTVSRSRLGAFSGIVGRPVLQAEARAVVRGGVNTTNGSVPALLLLDRTGCQSLTTASNGSGNLGVIVRRVSATDGGHAHVDSNGQLCGSNNTAYVVYASSNSNGGPSISVENATNGTLGTISTFASSIGSPRGGATYPSGISHPATAGPVVSRLPFDRQYNPSTRPAIGQLHATAYATVTMTPAAAATAGYAVVGCGADGAVAGAKVFVSCDNFQPTAAVFPDATDVVFSGQVSVGGGRSLSLPGANRVSIRGCPGCTGSGYYALNVAGSFYLNIGSSGLGAATCDDRQGPGAGGATTNTSVLTTFGSPVVVSGQARLCQTTLYMAANTPTYTRQAIYSGPPNCTGALPCPIVAGAAPGGSYHVSGNRVEWTAPNQLTTVSDEAHPFEDLAQWTESSDLSEVKSGGVMATAGIFFAPNAPVQFRSPASGSPRNAQFVARSLELLQGTLDMRPVTTDAVRVPLPGGYGIIR